MDQADVELDIPRQESRHRFHESAGIIFRHRFHAGGISTHRAHPSGRTPARTWTAGCRSRAAEPAGRGKPKYEVLADVPAFEYGIPVSFVETWEVEYYNGRARDIHGNPIGTEFSDGNFDGIAYDPDDPPIFENQAAYLDRHGLLTPAEKGSLAPEAFEPEAVCFAA